MSESQDNFILREPEEVLINMSEDKNKHESLEESLKSGGVAEKFSALLNGLGYKGAYVINAVFSQIEQRKSPLFHFQNTLLQPRKTLFQFQNPLLQPETPIFKTIWPYCSIPSAVFKIISV